MNIENIDMLEKHDFEYLKNIDFNSALYFSAVMSYKTIFNASVVLNCSAPTVSIMLKRFCSYFPVPLFEREGRCLRPTKYAVELDKMIGDTFLKFALAVNDDSRKAKVFE
ncbi:LysR family transcriptional regulator [Citrobacter enshiensis]|uniref:LysR family transcriptional regulator n=1 Tax=Citrobacter enshiensis TaxID=2971264 RepID=A0ABT8PZY9_9ENTR|nr:LysR family transcriptional regulator [Citrobacter enshiensis]MDN8601655.1 LysR family transcriptional regulator [Citrobacter enshiensis]WET40303.1 LysR family transcriptional regulator [Citrobacter enshiensis]